MRAFSALGLALVLAATLIGRARAYHTDRQRIVPGTAFTLHRGETQLGPFRYDYAPLEVLQVGTFVLPWVALFPNLQAKLLLFRSERWAVSLQPGLFYVNTNWPHAAYGVNFKDAHLELWVIPITGFVSAVIRRRFLLTLGAQYTGITGKGTYNPQDFRGTAAASNAQVGLDFQWRITPVVVLIWQGKLIAYQQAGGAGTVELQLDQNTTADIHAKGGAAAFRKSGGFSTSLAVFLSFRYLNLRAGVGYGDFSVPGINVIVPGLRPFPVFDLFWRWGGRGEQLTNLEFLGP